jgi:hypothetical protein
MAKDNIPAQVMQPNGQITAVDPQAFTKLPLARYYRDVAGNIVNAQSALYYDSATIIAGTAVTAAQKQALFTKGKNQDSAVLNTGTAIPEKGEFMTNMITDGEFEGGTTFILEQICVDLSLTADIATTYGTRGEMTAPNYTASVAISAANNFKAYTENLELQYVRNEDIKLRAPLRFWPSPFGASGAWGSPNGGFIQNGNGPSRFNMLSHPVVLQSEDRFSFVIQPIVATFTPTMTAVIRVVLLGKAIRTFTP